MSPVWKLVAAGGCIGYGFGLATAVVLGVPA